MSRIRSTSCATTRPSIRAVRATNIISSGQASGEHHADRHVDTSGSFRRIATLGVCSRRSRHAVPARTGRKQPVRHRRRHGRRASPAAPSPCGTTAATGSPSPPTAVHVPVADRQWQRLLGGRRDAARRARPAPSTNGSGTAHGNVTDVTVTCAPYTFTRRPLPAIYSTGKAVNYSPYRTAGGPRYSRGAQRRRGAAGPHAAATWPASTCCGCSAPRPRRPTWWPRRSCESRRRTSPT